MSIDPGPELHRDLGADLALVLGVLDAVDELTLAGFVARDVVVDWKANATEVTEIDRRAESVLVGGLLDERLDDAAFGEEHGLTGDPASAWRWMIDPIDGTSGFVRGIPVWATLVALTHVDHGAVLGVVSAPALARRWWGGRGLGSHAAALGGVRQLHVSDVADLGDAQVSVTFNDGWESLGRTDALVGLQHRARRARGFGDFWQHLLVAEGALDVAVDAVGVAPYDLAAIQPIVEAAGGTFTDRSGVATYQHDTAISTNGHLHPIILEALR